MVLLTGCKTEDELNETLDTKQTGFSKHKITIGEAKAYYLNKYNSNTKTGAVKRTTNFSPIEDFDLELLWELSYYPSNYSGNILMVPIMDSALISEKWTDAFMVFYHDTSNQVVEELMIFTMDEDYYVNLGEEPSVENYTGFTFHVNSQGDPSGFCYYLNGSIIGYTDYILINSDGTIGSFNQLSTRTWWEEFWSWLCGNDIECPTFGGGGGTGGRFWKRVGSWFNSLGNGLGGSGGSGGSGSGAFNGYGGFGGYGGFTGGGGFGSGGNWGYGDSNNSGSDGNPSRNLRDYFSELQIKQLTKAVDRLNEYFGWNKELIDYFIDFNLNADCLAEIAALQEPLVDGLESLPCLQKLIKYTTLKDQYDLDLSYEEFENFTLNCEITSPDFESCYMENVISFCMENINTYGDWDVEDGITNLCWQSLTLQKIDQGYYVLLPNIQYKFHHQQTNTWINMNLGNICIEVNGIDNNGQPLSNNDIKINIANALEKARLGVWSALNLKLAIPFSATLNIQYKIAVFANLQILFSGLPTIATGPSVCPGVTPSIPTWNCN